MLKYVKQGKEVLFLKYFSAIFLLGFYYIQCGFDASHMWGKIYLKNMMYFESNVWNLYTTLQYKRSAEIGK